MKITITSESTFIVSSKDAPVIGRSYNIEDAENGTTKQNKLFHSLLQEWYRSNLHSYKDIKSFEDFRNVIKKDFGYGFEKFVYISDPGLPTQKINSVKNYDEIPVCYRKMGSMFGILKSWSDYTKKQRKETIDNIISAMIQAGVNTKKFNEILEGIND